MSDTPPTTAICPVCFARGDETCVEQVGEMCPQPWRPKGPIPAGNPIQGLRAMWAGKDTKND